MRKDGEATSKGTRIRGREKNSPEAGRDKGEGEEFRIMVCGHHLSTTYSMQLEGNHFQLLVRRLSVTVSGSQQASQSRFPDIPTISPLPKHLKTAFVRGRRSMKRGHKEVNGAERSLVGGKNFC